MSYFDVPTTFPGIGWYEAESLGIGTAESLPMTDEEKAAAAKRRHPIGFAPKEPDADEG